MLRRAIAHLLPRRASPTIDLYFLDACAALVGDGRPIQRLAPTVFASESTRLVMRHDTGAPKARREEGLVYFLDDAVFEGVRDPTLPLSYRAKLWAVECAAAQRLLPRTDVLVVSTEEVAESLPRGLLRPGTRVVQLDPWWREPLPGLGHFDDRSPTEIAFLGAGTHTATARFVAETFRLVCAAHPDVRLTVSGNHARLMARMVPPEHLRVLKPVSWQEYRAQVATLRAHIALYPLPDTPFARARSSNKLIEHALVGAAPLYSASWPRSRLAVDANAGLALPLRQALWIETLTGLLASPREQRRLGEGAQRLAATVGRMAKQQALWRTVLCVGS